VSGFAGGVFENEQGRQRQPLPFSVDGKARMEGHLLAQESITNEKRAYRHQLPNRRRADAAPELVKIRHITHDPAAGF
jgi:hypothetical protein